MKLTNHNKNNHYTVDTYTMHGTIIMTEIEYTNVLDYLRRQFEKAKQNKDTYIRDSLSFISFYTGKIYEKPNEIVSLGVCATKLLAKKYNLKNYKDQNYGIKII